MVLQASRSGSSYHIKESLWKRCFSVPRGCCYSAKALHSVFVCWAEYTDAPCEEMSMGYILLPTPLPPRATHLEAPRATRANPHAHTVCFVLSCDPLFLSLFSWLFVSYAFILGYCPEIMKFLRPALPVCSRPGISSPAARCHCRSK